MGVWLSATLNDRMIGLKLVEGFKPVGRTGGGSGGIGGRNPPFCRAWIADRLKGEASPNMFSEPWGAPNRPPRPDDSAGGSFAAVSRALAAASGPVGPVEGAVDEGGWVASDGVDDGAFAGVLGSCPDVGAPAGAGVLGTEVRPGAGTP